MDTINDSFQVGQESNGFAWGRRISVFIGIGRKVTPNRVFDVTRFKTIIEEGIVNTVKLFSKTVGIS